MHLRKDMSKENAMLGINDYGRELTKEELDTGYHRQFIGGMWEEIGLLQFNFMKEQGLEPKHKILDIGCGCLRGGLHFIGYLDQGNYYGLDVNRSVLKGGILEVRKSNLISKKPNLMVSDKFIISKFKTQFDFMISVSLFTHLPMNMIVRCLVQVRNHLKPKGTYYSSFFESPTNAHIDPLKHGEIITYYDKDPFHYSAEELTMMADLAGLGIKIIGDWGHPRHQRMAAFFVK